MFATSFLGRRFIFYVVCRKQNIGFVWLRICGQPGSVVGKASPLHDIVTSACSSNEALESSHHKISCVCPSPEP